MTAPCLHVEAFPGTTKVGYDDQTVSSEAFRSTILQAGTLGGPRVERK
jgi:hypothetical protein